MYSIIFIFVILIDYYLLIIRIYKIPISVKAYLLSDEHFHAPNLLNIQ